MVLISKMEFSMIDGIIDQNKEYFFKSRFFSSYGEMFIFICKLFWLDEMVRQKFNIIIDLTDDDSLVGFLDYLVNVNILNKSDADKLYNYIRTLQTFHSYDEYLIALDFIQQIIRDIYKNLE